MSGFEDKNFLSPGFTSKRFRMPSQFHLPIVNIVAPVDSVDFIPLFDPTQKDLRGSLCPITEKFSPGSDDLLVEMARSSLRVAAYYLD